MADSVALLHISVSYSPAARVVHTLDASLPAGARVSDAVALCAADARFDGSQGAYVAVWGVKASADQLLEPGDRVELCRPLRVDPKVARRERFAKQGARTSGLFLQRRPGAKPGY
jgi:uncharacterized protein